MTSNIMQRAADALFSPATAGEGLPRRLAREVSHAVDREAARGLVRAAGAQADAYVADTVIRQGAFVTHTAMTCAAELSAYEEYCVRQAPLGERRYQFLVDSFTALAAHEITTLGRNR